MKCEQAQQQLPFLLYGELPFDQEEQLQRHLDRCGPCQGEAARWKSLHGALDSREMEPPPSLLFDARRGLRANLASMAAAPKRPWWQMLWLQPVGAVALVALGFFGSRLVPSLSPRFSSEPLASRVTYLEPDESGRVDIVVEETRQRTLSGHMEDEPIRRLLLTAARESSDPGLRVESMDLLKSRSETTEVRRALLYALQHDKDPGVRLKALDGIRSLSGLADTRKALAHVVLFDDNPGVRTQAIDLLTQTREPAMVGVLQELMQREDNKYIRLRCQRVLAEMNASVETF